MTGMQLYVKFMFALAIGLAGLSVMMKTVLETVLSEWDPVRHAAVWWRRLSHSRPNADSVRAEDILSELEGRRHGRYAPRPSRPIDQRRQVLRDMREADERLSSPEPVEAL